MDQALPTDVLMSAERFHQDFQLVVQTLNAVQAAVIVLDAQGQILHCTPHGETVLGHELAALRGRYFWEFLTYPADVEQARQIWASPEAERFPCEQIWRWLQADGKICRLSWNLVAILDSDNQVEYGVATGIEVLETPTELIHPQQQQTEQDLSLAQATLESVADGIIAISTDAQIVSYNQRFVEMWQVPEAILKSPDHKKRLSFLAAQVKDPEGFVRRVLELYQQPESVARDLIELKDGRSFERWTLPQKMGDRIIGRVWNFRDITQFKQAELWLQQQAERYQQVQQHNIELEGQVQAQTAQLQQALHFETILKRITDKVRDSLDEGQILQTAVQELGKALQVECCDTGIYSDDYTTSTVCYEYTSLESAQGKSIQLDNSNPIHRNLLQGEYVQFCEIAPDSVRNVVRRFAILACPIFDDQGVLGDLWLFKPREGCFNDLDIRLVQQMANQCAIAIRQARLYQAAQAQVQELGQLNRLKDDFLSTISHELRTPVTSMRMALQMLGISLNQENGLFAEFSKPPHTQSRTARYFQILREECEREIRLIDDLLDLQRLGHETTPPIQALIQLQDWLPSIVQPFYERAERQQQTLEICLPDQLPPLRSSPNHLERVVTELLENACKYSPAEQHIRLEVEAISGWMHFRVTNTGVEIQESEIARIFDQFYRIPSNDPWKQGGTGLGLALVCKLMKQLGGTVVATSDNGQTCFTLQIPMTPSAGGEPTQSRAG